MISEYTLSKRIFVCDLFCELIRVYESSPNRVRCSTLVCKRNWKKQQGWHWTEAKDVGAVTADVCCGKCSPYARHQRWWWDVGDVFPRRRIAYASCLTRKLGVEKGRIWKNIEGEGFDGCEPVSGMIDCRRNNRLSDFIKNNRLSSRFFQKLWIFRSYQE